jgi:hypothetical protein
MNLFVLKYCILIGAVLTSTALVTGPLNPQKLFTEETMTDSGEITADSIYQFGSDVFYRELDKPGNEYMKAGMEGYSRELVPTERQEEAFSERWEKGVSLFNAGYRECIGTYYQIATIPDIDDRSREEEVCAGIRNAKDNLRLAGKYFIAAKSCSSAGSGSGFTIGMTIPRVAAVADGAEDMEMSCMRAVLADRANDPEEFRKNMNEAGDSLRDMKLQYAELKALSGDFA